MNTTQLAGSGFQASAAPIGNWLAGVLDRLGRRAAPSIRLVSFDVSLAFNARHWVRRPLGCEIFCKEGTLWLTFDNEPADIVLEAGESHRCSVDSALLIQALQSARFQVR